MVPAEERVRFCDRCNAVIGWFASVCEECGAAAGASANAKAGAAQPSAASNETDLFRAHMKLLHRVKEEVARLDKDTERFVRHLEKLDAESRGPETTRSLVEASERFFDFEERWDEIQRTYNRQSEAIEEEFLERIEELQADLELSTEHQGAIDEELRGFTTGLEAAEARLREAGRYLDTVQARKRSRALPGFGGARGTALLGGLAVAFALGGAAYGYWVLGLPPLSLVCAVGPALLGIGVLFFHAQRLCR